MSSYRVHQLMPALSTRLAMVHDLCAASPCPRCALPLPCLGVGPVSGHPGGRPAAGAPQRCLLGGAVPVPPGAGQHRHHRCRGCGWQVRGWHCTAQAACYLGCPRPKVRWLLDAPGPACKPPACKPTLPFLPSCRYDMLLKQAWARQSALSGTVAPMPPLHGTGAPFGVQALLLFSSCSSMSRGCTAICAAHTVRVCMHASQAMPLPSH